MNNFPSPLEKKEIIFDQKEIFPYGKLGRQINWNKIFDQKCRAHYPKAINRNNIVNDDGNFDLDKFIFSRLSTINKRFSYLKYIDEIISFLSEVPKSELKYILKSSLIKLIKQFEEMYFLWNKNSEVYEKDFYIELKSLLEEIENAHSIEVNIDTTNIITTINNVCKKGLTWEEQERGKYIETVKNNYQESAKKYVNEDNSLNIDAILADLVGGWNRNNEAMLIAFYSATSSKIDLKRLQDWVIAALNKNIKKLDTEKAFTIIEWVLPYIFYGFEFNFDLPEIFRPEYLQHISIYSLTLENFTHQVESKGNALWRSKDTQNKLIEQFKEFWQKEEGKIWFWQWSEELWMRQNITGCINAENFKHYLYEEDLWLDKIPVPKILENNRDDKKEDLLKALE